MTSHDTDEAPLLSFYIACLCLRILDMNLSSYSDINLRCLEAVTTLSSVLCVTESVVLSFLWLQGQLWLEQDFATRPL